MKTLQDLYNEVITNDELKTEFMEAAKDGRTMGFLKAHGCEATEEELAVFLKERTMGELSDDELDNAAGGGCNKITGAEALLSMLGGVFCGIIAAASAIGGHNGQDNDTGGRLCTMD